MPAKKHKTTAARHAEVQTPTVARQPVEPDVFDDVIAARDGVAPAAVAETPLPGGSTSAETTVVDESRSEAVHPTAYQPDPWPHLTVPLGDGADAPRVRLFRNRRMNQVAVRFDEKPAEPVRQRMRDEGYKWREAEGVWTKQLDDQKATGQLAAERLVGEVANGIRAEAGLPPVGRTPGEWAAAHAEPSAGSGELARR